MTLSRSTLRPIDGSTVHLGTYCCEVFECVDRWLRRPAAWSCWRIRNGRVVATWIICDHHIEESRALDELGEDRHLPLVRPVLVGDEAWTAVECFVLELARLGGAIAEHPHEERGCWHQQAGLRRPCWCGRWSLLDTRWLDGQGDAILYGHRVCDRGALRRADPRGGLDVTALALRDRPRRGCDRCVSIMVDGPEGPHTKSCGCQCTPDGCPHASAPWAVQLAITELQLALPCRSRPGDGSEPARHNRLIAAGVRLRIRRWWVLEGQRGYAAEHAGGLPDEQLLHPRWAT